MSVCSQSLAAACNLALLGATGVDALRSPASRRLWRHLRTALAGFGRLGRRQADRPGSRRRQEQLSGRARPRGKARAQLHRVASASEQRTSDLSFLTCAWEALGAAKPRVRTIAVGSNTKSIGCQWLCDTRCAPPHRPSSSEVPFCGAASSDMATPARCARLFRQTTWLDTGKGAASDSQRFPTCHFASVCLWLPLWGRRQARVGLCPHAVACARLAR